MSYQEVILGKVVGDNGLQGPRGPKGAGINQIVDLGNNRIKIIYDDEQELEMTLDTITGPLGPKGDRGPLGPKGPKGDKGEGVSGIEKIGDNKIRLNYGEGQFQDIDLNVVEGPIGPKGDRGEKGDTGKSALDLWKESLGSGNEGKTFSDLLKSLKGERGPIGERGPVGPQGLQGIQGPQGPQGEKGEQGPIGERGPVGPQGLQGIQGVAGPTGPAGKSISSITKDGENNVHFIMTDGSDVKLKFPIDAGRDGQPGPAGKNGDSVTNIKQVGEEIVFTVGEREIKIPVPQVTAPESKFVDVRMSASATKTRIFEEEKSKIVFTIANSGSISAPRVELNLSNTFPSSQGIQIEQSQIDKVKAEVETVTANKSYVITNLESGGSVIISMVATFPKVGSFTFSGNAIVRGEIIDKSADDNRASVTVDVGSHEDTSYVPTQSCPALRVIDVDSGKQLSLVNYSRAVRVNGKDTYIRSFGPSTNRLNVYSPDTTQIKLRMPNAGTVQITGWKIVDGNGNYAIPTPTGGKAVYEAAVDNGVAYTYNGSKYLLDASMSVYVNDENVFAGIQPMLGVTENKRGTRFPAPFGVSFSKDEDILTINGLSEGTWLAVNMRPAGENCEFQTVAIVVPYRIPNDGNGTSLLSKISGNENYFSIVTSGEAVQDDKDFVSVNGPLNSNMDIVNSRSPIASQLSINAPSGVENRFEFSVSGGKLSMNNKSVGNVEITPTDGGRKLTIVIKSTATRADNFVYNNNGTTVNVKIS